MNLLRWNQLFWITLNDMKCFSLWLVESCFCPHDFFWNEFRTPNRRTFSWFNGTNTNPANVCGHLSWKILLSANKLYFQSCHLVGQHQKWFFWTFHFLLRLFVSFHTSQSEHLPLLIFLKKSISFHWFIRSQCVMQFRKTIFFLQDAIITLQYSY